MKTLTKINRETFSKQQPTGLLKQLQSKVVGPHARCVISPKWRPRIVDTLTYAKASAVV